MRLFGYRRPSLNTALGITRAKKRANKALGITALKRPFRAPQNAKRRALRRVGYYSGRPSSCASSYACFASARGRPATRQHGSPHRVAIPP
jgi:hypothetical protein